MVEIIEIYIIGIYRIRQTFSITVVNIVLFDSKNRMHFKGCHFRPELDLRNVLHGQDTQWEGSRMISTICRRIAESLGSQLKTDDDVIAVYAYSLEILLGSAVKLMLIITVASMFHILIPALLFLFTFCLFRWLGGGVHASTYLRCMMIVLLLTLGMAYAATLPVNTLQVLILYGLSLLIAIYVIIRWVPAGTNKRRINDAAKRLRQKKESLCALAVWSIVVFSCILDHHNCYATAVILGSLCSSFFIMPVGYQFIGALDSLLETMGKGGEDIAYKG